MSHIESRLSAPRVALLILTAALLAVPAVPVLAQALDNAACLGCHGNAGFAMPGADGKPRSLEVAKDRFERSVHGKMNLPCTACHMDVSEVPHKAPVQKVDCGNCHAAQKQEYLGSVHGDERVWKLNPKAATCSSCHTTHDIQSPKTDAGKVAIVQQCGSCHADKLKSFFDTYHGKVTALGYSYAAKCADCHGAHGIQRAHDPASSVHPDNRLKTCQKCHAGATAGFVTFQPHANTHDFARYPYMWVASKFMIALLAGVFAFFWTHTLLWFFREYRDRKEGKTLHRVIAADLPQLHTKHFNRFTLPWRIGHLLFALSVMLLVMTGMAVLYAETGWAKIIVDVLGGPQTSAILHRVSAATMLGIFFIHLVYMAVRVVPRWGLRDWFGPTSLVPNWKDLADMIGMFKWFFGMAPRPVFGRWTYWEKFDYWAVFWGMGIIGGSGMMLAFKEVTAAVLPGWTFNVAMLIHGEEAILAAVFLFTVHFFNNHFRPDKFPPPDIVMFTGTVSLEEFAREHTLDYEALLKSGELQRHLVDAPSRPMTIGSRILGITLIIIGLALLTLVVTGFVADLRT